MGAGLSWRGALAPLFIAAVAGVAQAMALAWPGSGAPQWWLQIVSLAVFARLLCQPISWQRAALLGWVFATAWLTATFWWLFISMHAYAGLAAPLAVAAVLGLALFLGAYYAVVSGLFRAFVPVHKAWAALFFAACWLLAELARGTWWTGFPWGAGGYAHVEGPLAALARWVGVYGIGAVAAAFAMGLAQLRVRDLRRARTWLLALALAALLAAAHGQRACALGDLSGLPGCTREGQADPKDGAKTPGRVRLALLQGNIPQDEKFQPGTGVALALRWYGEALLQTQAALVVAPETAIPLLPQQLIPGYLETIAAHFKQGAQAGLLGIPLGDADIGYTNSALGFAPGQAKPYRYDKHHLVPFGEFIPPFFRWFTEMMNIPLGDFNRGGVGQPSFAWAGQRFAPNICYEDLFGEELAARFADATQAPTVFVNLSNIAWFGDTLAIDQHLQISRMRALEFERPMVRATNTGATAIIDYRGTVTHQLPRLTRGVLYGTVQGRGTDAAQGGDQRTPYARWAARWGLAPLWLAAFGVVFSTWLRWWRQQRRLLTG